MVYMPSDSAVLFPRLERSPMRRRQEGLRSARERTVSGARALAEQMDGVGVSRMLSDIAERSVLILGRFTDARKTVPAHRARHASTAVRPASVRLREAG
jgi:hypothetical protein